MLRTRVRPLHVRAAAVVAVAVLAAACDDDGGLVDAGGECTALQQTEADIEEGRASGKARVRINLISRVGAGTDQTGQAEVLAENVSLQGGELYLGNDCYRVDNTASTTLGAMENDMGMAAVEVSVDPGEVTELLVRASGPAGGRTYRAEKITLEEPVRLEPGTRTDIYLALTPIGTSNEVQATFVAAGMLPWDATAMVFDPVRGGKMSMPGGFSMDLPVGSVTEPTVFGVSEHRTGDVSAVYNIYPESELSVPVKISFPIDRARIPQGLAMSDYGGRIGSGAAASTVDGNTATVTAETGLGQVRMWTEVPYIETINGERFAMDLAPPSEPVGPVARSRNTANLVDTNECYWRLVDNQASLLASVDRNYAIRTTLCENVAPHLHIVLVNLSRGTLANHPRIQIVGTRYTDGTFALREISTHITSVNEFAAINGFTWTGDKGFDWGGYGTPVGTLYMNGTRVSPWYSGTEAMIGFASYSATTGTPAQFFERINGGGVNFGAYYQWVVPSTTSIVKNGWCSQTGGTYDRYSTMGIGKGVLVLASSVSGTTTNDRDLCTVYEGMGMFDGAIRLDGGSAAAISWLGTTLNTLTGSDFVALGDERSIPYILAANYP